MAISDTQKAALDKMCITAKDVALGTEIQRIGVIADGNASAFGYGTHTVSSAEGTAGTCTINTSKTITGFIVQVYRSGILEGNYDVTKSTTNLTVATNGTNYVLTSGDVINYIVF